MSTFYLCQGCTDYESKGKPGDECATCGEPYPVKPQTMYEALGELFFKRGIELGKGRALTPDEAVADPECSAYMDKLIDQMLGVGEPPS